MIQSIVVQPEVCLVSENTGPTRSRFCVRAEWSNPKYVLFQGIVVQPEVCLVSEHSGPSSADNSVVAKDHGEVA